MIEGIGGEPETQRKMRLGEGALSGANEGDRK